MGADQAYLVTDRKFAGADTLATSYVLSEAIRKIGAFDFVDEAEFVESLLQAVNPFEEDVGTLALLPGLGAIVVVGLHLVAGGLQRESGLGEQRLPAGVAGQRGQRRRWWQALGPLLAAASFGLARAVGALLGGVIGILTELGHANLP